MKILGYLVSIFFLNFINFLFNLPYIFGKPLYLSQIAFTHNISPNLPAPINAGEENQIKKGGLTIQGDLIAEGILKLAQFADNPDGAKGALYFNTADNKIKVYSSGAWNDLGGGAEPGQLPTYTTAERDALSPSAGLMIYNTDYDQIQTFTGIAWSGITGNKDLAIECDTGMDCASGFCVDSACCDTSPDNCNGDCEACNLLDYRGVCTLRTELDNTEVTTTCNYCNGVSNISVAYTGNTGVNCTGINGCSSGICQNSYCDEDNDSHYSNAPAVCASGRYSFAVGDDCDDSCLACYPGSTSYTTSPDGLDQDCDGNIDETACISHTVCGYTNGPYCDTICSSEGGDCLCSSTDGYLYTDNTCTSRYGNEPMPSCGIMRSADAYSLCVCGKAKYH